MLRRVKVGMNRYEYISSTFVRKLKHIEVIKNNLKQIESD